MLDISLLGEDSKQTFILVFWNPRQVCCMPQDSVPIGKGSELIVIL